MLKLTIKYLLYIVVLALSARPYSLYGMMLYLPIFKKKHWQRLRTSSLIRRELKKNKGWVVTRIAGMFPHGPVRATVMCAAGWTPVLWTKSSPRELRAVTGGAQPTNACRETQDESSEEPESARVAGLFVRCSRVLNTAAANESV